MNFQEWYKSYRNNSVPFHPNEIRYETMSAWDACKNEVLKIIREEVTPLSDTNGNFDISGATIDKIEKL